MLLKANPKCCKNISQIIPKFCCLQNLTSFEQKSYPRTISQMNHFQDSINRRPSLYLTVRPSKISQQIKVVSSFHPHLFSGTKILVSGSLKGLVLERKIATLHLEVLDAASPPNGFETDGDWLSSSKIQVWVEVCGFWGGKGSAVTKGFWGGNTSRCCSLNIKRMHHSCVYIYIILYIYIYYIHIYIYIYI